MRTCCLSPRIRYSLILGPPGRGREGGREGEEGGREEGRGGREGGREGEGEGRKREVSQSKGIGTCTSCMNNTTYMYMYIHALTVPVHVQVHLCSKRKLHVHDGT